MGEPRGVEAHGGSFAWVESHGANRMGLKPHAGEIKPAQAGSWVATGFSRFVYVSRRIHSAARIGKRNPSFKITRDKMPYYRLFYHLIWSTKNRLPLIDPELEKGLYPYLQQKAREIDCRILAVNGIGDHIHLVIEIPPQRSVSDVVKHLKGASSHEFGCLNWQRGYGALTVEERNLEAALNYVNQQKEHHARQTIYSKLERSDEDPNEVPPGIREEPGAYQVGEEDPFEFC